MKELKGKINVNCVLLKEFFFRGMKVIPWLLALGLRTHNHGVAGSNESNYIENDKNKGS
jgi:hypothetical protein